MSMMMNQDSSKYGVDDPHPYFNNKRWRLFSVKFTIAYSASGSYSVQIVVAKMEAEFDLTIGRRSPANLE
jgi:hypothetical protein